jgi:hypothetical protein
MFFFSFFKNNFIMNVGEFLMPFFSLFILFFLFSCDEKRPPSNTLDHKSAHGYVEGEVTELYVGKTLLQIPPDVRFSPETSGKITKSYADNITLGLHYPEFYIDGLDHGVSITLYGYGSESPEEWDKKLNNKKWKKVVPNNDLELWEYHANKYDGSWGYVTYLAMNDANRTPKGSLIKYICAGHPSGKVVSCRSHFVLGDGLYIDYKILRVHLPYWKKIHQDVVNHVNNLIAK